MFNFGKRKTRKIQEFIPSEGIEVQFFEKNCQRYLGRDVRWEKMVNASNVGVSFPKLAFGTLLLTESVGTRRLCSHFEREHQTSMLPRNHISFFSRDLILTASDQDAIRRMRADARESRRKDRLRADRLHFG